jgi:NADH:ubiquinone oxidoreductase subunit 3 (subunit A)
MKNDVTYLLILIAFFALAAVFVIACDKIIGPDEAALHERTTGEPEPEPEEREELAA